VPIIRSAHAAMAETRRLQRTVNDTRVARLPDASRSPHGSALIGPSTAGVELMTGEGVSSRGVRRIVLLGGR
jgi:hypothetical protein